MHEKENEGKIVEIEENRGVNDKMLVRIHSQPSVSFSFENSLFSHPIEHLEHSWSTLTLAKERKGRQRNHKESNGHARKIWIKQLQQEYLRAISCVIT